MRSFNDNDTVEVELRRDTVGLILATILMILGWGFVAAAIWIGGWISVPFWALAIPALAVGLLGYVKSSPLDYRDEHGDPIRM